MKVVPRSGTLSTVISRSWAASMVFTMASPSPVPSDTGCGIPPEDLPHVFDRFYRANGGRDHDGARGGLGLAIAKGIVEAHGGEIGIESAIGDGTRVWFTLPQ